MTRLPPLLTAYSSEEANVHPEPNEFWAEEFWAEDEKVRKARLINRRQLQLLLPVSPMTIWRYEKQGLLPKHIKIVGLSFWRLTDVLDAIERLVGSDAA